MTDLPRNPAVLAPHAPQLPVSWYFDDRIYALEQQHLFAAGPQYVGHELVVPKVGDYYTLAWEDHARMLVRHAEGSRGIDLITNICRHRQAIMLEGRGNTSNIVCPLHRWTYDLQGGLLGAPHFPNKPCLDLARAQVQRWHGLLFAGARDVAADFKDFGATAEFDFSNYVYDRTVVHEYQHNWKTFIETYLEDYHVEPFHPGLSGFVNCADLRWEFGARYSVQKVGLQNHLARAGTPTYSKWHDVVRQFHGKEDPRHGAIWALFYPNVMLEWYPQVLVVSVLIPRGPQHTTNVVQFFYPEEIALFEREYVEAQQAAYLETAIEDDEIALRIDRGRAALHAMGKTDAGPYQSPLEDGMLQFHEYMRRELGPHLDGSQQ